MIKTLTFSFLFAFFCLTVLAQNSQIDDLAHRLASAKNDTTRALIMAELSFIYQNSNPDSAFAIANRTIELSQMIHFPKGEVRGLIALANDIDSKGDLAGALELNFRGLKITVDKDMPLEKSMCLINIGNIYWDLTDFPRAISFYQQAVLISGKINDQPGALFWRMVAETNLGAVYMLNGQLDSAFVHLQKVYNETLDGNDLHASVLLFLGDLEFRMGKRNEGLSKLRQSIDLLQAKSDHYTLADACRFISECFRDMNMPDSSIYYAKKGLGEAQSIGYKSPIFYTSRILAELYEPKDILQALHYRKLFDSANDIYYGPNKVKDLQKTISDEQDRQRLMEAAAIASRNRLIQYGLLLGLSVILLIAFILYRNNRQKKKVNSLLQHQKEKVESTLKELKATQAQLIQSEKMASLGELTAGIAHEIQNPLNFVNNFSEVSRELIEELKKLKSNPDSYREKSEERDEILNDIDTNLEKINHHGKRADAIVKGMLQHSQTSTGKKEPTDINKLADEYLRLSYHGLRAKDESFNVTMKTDFDESIGNINIIPQDIGRVLLNVYNNAFYASPLPPPVGGGFKDPHYKHEPTVWVSTKKKGDKVFISIRDNGPGISEKIVDKIFQPFFTTKPTGQGTGLGLSLAYDIVKAHGGELKVETKVGEGSEFIIMLPS